MIDLLSEEHTGMTFPNHKRSALWISIFIFFLIACDATFSILIPTPTIPVPTASQTATETSLPPLSQQLTLVSVPFIETNPGSNFPSYSITAQTPQLTGSDDPRVLAFNQRLSDLVSKEVDIFRQSFQELPITPNSNGSFLDVTYTTVSQLGDLWSFKFDFSFYADTAAHPGLNSRTLNYDLGQGRELTLGDLFLPDSNYLETISAYCMNELRKQPFAESSSLEGAQPSPENYRNWNIEPGGVMITFDMYQVAPGASGPQKIVVPYGELTSIINPEGPLAVVPK
jgi:Protein of unknown function (DUF3298)